MENAKIEEVESDETPPATSNAITQSDVATDGDGDEDQNDDDDLFYRTKRKTRKACFNCKNAHACCNDERPCSRCVKLGMGKICFDTEGKKRGRKPKVPRLEKSNSALIVPLPVIGASKSAPEPTTPSTPSTPITSLTPSASAIVVPPIITSPAPIVKNGKVLIHATPNTHVRPKSTGTPKPSPAIKKPTIKTQEKKERSVAEINRLLMNEIKELKSDQRKLYEELRALKETNQRGNSTTRTKSTTQPGTAVPSQSVETPIINQVKAVVIFDLTKSIPAVMNCNETFCHMLGYNQDEVIGSSWHKFVHPLYIERAFEILKPHMTPRANKLNDGVKFEQVYQTKSGETIRTEDTHTIFFKDGKPETNLVTISPFVYPVKPGDTPMLDKPIQPLLSLPSKEEDPLRHLSSDPEVVPYLNQALNRIRPVAEIKAETSTETPTLTYTTPQIYTQQEGLPFFMTSDTIPSNIPQTPETNLPQV